jgi:hypothetical protein
MKTLESKLTALQLLYSCKLLIRGEQRPGSIARLIDHLEIVHGSSAIDALISDEGHPLSFPDLRKALGKYGVELFYVPF